VDANLTAAAMRPFFAFFFLIASLLTGKSFSQTNMGFGSTYVGNTNMLLLNTPDALPDVEGSPYVPAAKFTPGWVVQGKDTYRQSLRFNALTGQIEFIHDGKLHGVAPAIGAAGIVVAPGDTVRFERGYASVGTRTPTDFYQVLYSGNRVRLLKATRATIKKNEDQMSSDFGKKSFRLADEYFVWYAATPSSGKTRISPYDGQLTPVVSSRKSIMAALPQQASRVEQYATEQKVKLKTWEEIVGVLRVVDSQ
jgi:hypothetical protein